MRFRVGVDVGGTFTDFLVSSAGHVRTGLQVLYDPRATRRSASSPASSRPRRTTTWRSHEFLDHVESIVHGTTITTNAVLTGTGAKTGFITTKGFRDVLNMRRGMKERQFEKYAPPPPLVPRI